jgi:hypothetical protein
MVKGIVYLYVSPSCKCYVGQTFEPNKRRKSITAHGYKWKYKESSTTSKS